jgi:hypothetical protein
LFWEQTVPILLTKLRIPEIMLGEPADGSLFLFDVLAALPTGMDGPWGKVLVETKFRGDQQAMRNTAGTVALEAGRQKWGTVRPYADLVAQPCTCDLARLPEPDYEDQLGRAWVLSPELQALVHLG